MMVQSPSWINKSVLDAHIGTLHKNISEAFAKAAFKRQENVIDPFATAILAKQFGFGDAEQLKNLQDIESGLRGASNAIGVFHQNVLGSVKGWNNHDAGYDLECPSRKLLAEIKNKHNTMNASNEKKVLDDLETAIRQKSAGWTAYIVKIIPKTSQRYEINVRKGVKETEGVSFYHLVTGEPNALHQLFDYVCHMSQLSESIQKYCSDILKNSLPPSLP